MAESSTTIDAAALVKTHQAGVWRYLRVLGCEATLADDLTQETFLYVLRRPFTDNGPRAAAAYLRKVARSLFITHQRKRQPDYRGDNLDAIDAAWSNMAKDDDGQEAVDALTACLEALTPRAREALVLRFRDQRSRREIAESLDLSEDGAKNLLQRSKQQLRSCVERRLRRQD